MRRYAATARRDATTTPAALARLATTIVAAELPAVYGNAFGLLGAGVVLGVGVDDGDGLGLATVAAGPQAVARFVTVPLLFTAEPVTAAPAFVLKSTVAEPLWLFWSVKFSTSTLFVHV